MTDDDKRAKGNLPAVTGGRAIALPGQGKAKGKTSSFLARVRSGTAGPDPRLPVAAKAGSRQDLMAAAIRPSRPRLIFAIDATASREAAWAAASKTTDSLFAAVPGELDVALAVHGGSAVHTFTDFTSNPATLRDAAAGVTCQGGRTVLLEIMERARATPDLKVVVYIGDVFEESVPDGMALADDLRLRGTRMIVLHDLDGGDDGFSAKAFESIAKRTGGCVLPFDAASATKLRELLEALAVLAVGGPKLLEARRKSLPGATLLLGHLGSG